MLLRCTRTPGGGGGGGGGVVALSLPAAEQTHGATKERLLKELNSHTITLLGVTLLRVLLQDNI